MVDPTTDAELLALISDYRSVCTSLEAANSMVRYLSELKAKYENEAMQLECDQRELERKLLSRVRWPGVTANAEGDLRVVLTLNDSSEVYP